MERINVRTKSRVELVDITAKVETALKKAGVREGMCFIFCPHTTAGLTINENADPSVQRDIIGGFERMVPAGQAYSHSEGNADSHIKASMWGASLNLFIEEGCLCLGRWQGVYFCEADGPRSREVWIKFIADA